jgi:hypothetical protein
MKLCCLINLYVILSNALHTGPWSFVLLKWGGPGVFISEVHLVGWVFVLFYRDRVSLALAGLEFLILGTRLVSTPRDPPPFVWVKGGHPHTLFPECAQSHLISQVCILASYFPSFKLSLLAVSMFLVHCFQFTKRKQPTIFILPPTLPRSHLHCSLTSQERHLVTQCSRLLSPSRHPVPSYLPLLSRFLPLYSYISEDILELITILLFPPVKLYKNVILGWCSEENGTCCASLMT